jgi:hypothetical protein
MSLVAVRPSYGQNFIPGVSPFFQVRPGLNISQASANMMMAGRALQNFPPYAFNSPSALSGNGNPYLGGSVSLSGNPYAGYGGASPYMTSAYDPSYGGTLKGSAELVNAEGKFIIDQQQSLTMREQRRGEKIKNDRDRFDLMNYERERTPSAEELRLRGLQQQVMRSRNNPPVTEITSGKALNDLMQDIRSVPARGDTAQLRTFQSALSEATLKHINVTKGQGNIGLLKNEGRLSWPVALSSVDFKDDRAGINALVHDAVRQAGFNSQVDSGTIMQLIKDTDSVRARLRRTGTDLPPSMYIEANVFLNNFDEAIRALQQPDVGSHFAGTYVLKAKTVAELVHYLTSQGLQFAPAVPGDEAAYVAVQQALAAYDRAINPGIEKELAAKK